VTAQRLMILAACAIGGLSACAFAGEPPADDRDFPRMRREWMREDGQPAVLSGTEEEIATFMKTHSPKRWQRFQDLGSERREKLFHSIRQQYHWMQRLKEDDRQIYDLRLKRLPIEDAMFDLSWQLRHADAKDEAELRAQLRQQVRAFLDSSLAERELRLARWRERVRQGQEMIQREESRLAEASANREQMIEHGMKLVEDQNLEQLKRWAGPMFGPRSQNPGPLDETPPATTQAAQ
jgi:hypothetical protein